MQLLTPHAERCALFASNYKEDKRSFTELIDLVDFCIRDIINLTQEEENNNFQGQGRFAKNF
jgi:hypothetical protein